MAPRLGRVAVVAGIIAFALVPASGASEAEGDGGAASPGDPTDIALAYARAQRGALGLTEADVADLLVADVVRSAHTGVTHVYLRQRHERLEVLGADMTVNVARDGTVIHAPSRFLSDIASTASGTAALSAAEAVAAAADALDLELTGSIEVLRADPGPAGRTRLSGGGISLSPISAKLVYQPGGAERIRLAWNLEIQEVSQEHWWNVSVDAATGELLAKHEYVDHDNAEATAAAVAPAASVRGSTAAGVEDGSSYRVFQLPLESPNDGPRTLVENPADEVASPFGWHDTNAEEGPEFTVTQGNNASAYIDTGNAGTPLPLTQAQGGSDLTFDYPWDPQLPPTANKDAATTNLFYWNNTIHDVFYHYGFDEEAGNFQVNNYGRGGTGGDDVRAEAQDGSGVNNANFATPPDGQRPRMQMFVWTSGLAADQEIIDGDFDAGVIVHEYGHGISNRLTGGPSVTNCLGNQERPSEGWSDWLALGMLALPSESGEQPRGIGTYVLNEDSRQDDGIRPTPYSTDMSIDPATYDDVKTLAVPHGVGYVWATITWETFWDLVEVYGFNPDVRGDWTTGGNNLAIQLIMDGMKFQPCNPGFVDARDAILAADVALTGGQNQCLLWRGFAKRGLGFSADQGSPLDRSDGTEAFDTHPDCLDFEGFFGPLKGDGLKDANAGSTVPVVFSLGGDKGLDIFANGFPASREISCDGTEEPLIGEPTTLFFHATAPASDIDEAVEFGGAGGGPFMDPNPPTLPTPKVATATPVGNRDFRKNPLLAYWAGEVTGVLTGDPTVTFWAQSALGTRMEVTLFGDGGVGAGTQLARETVEVGAAGPTRVDLTFEGLEATVREEVVVQIIGQTAAGGSTDAEILFDSTEFPSSFSFDLAEMPDVSGTPTDPRGGGLTYDADTDRYTYPWATDADWAGTCRRLIVQFKASGEEQTADVRFK